MLTNSLRRRPWPSPVRPRRPRACRDSRCIARSRAPRTPAPGRLRSSQATPARKRSSACVSAVARQVGGALRDVHGGLGGFDREQGRRDVEAHAGFEIRELGLALVQKRIGALDIRSRLVAVEDRHVHLRRDRVRRLRRARAVAERADVGVHVDARQPAGRCGAPVLARGFDSRPRAGHVRAMRGGLADGVVQRRQWQWPSSPTRVVSSSG